MTPYDKAYWRVSFRLMAICALGYVAGADGSLWAVPIMVLAGILTGRLADRSAMEEVSK